MSPAYGQEDPYSNDWQADQRGRLLVSTQRVDASSESLMNAHRIAIETENVGTNVLSELHTQRQQLERARDNVNNKKYE